MDNGLVVAAGVIGSVLTLLAREMIPAIIKMWSTKSTLDRRKTKDETDAERRDKKEQRDALREYVDLLKQDQESLKRELVDLRAKCEEDIREERERTQDCERRHGEAERFKVRAETWIRAMQDALHRHNIQFPDYDPDKSSVITVPQRLRAPPPPEEMK